MIDATLSTLVGLIGTSGSDAVDGSSARHVSAIEVACQGSYDSEELLMQTVATIGLDIAKSVFQVHRHFLANDQTFEL